MKKIHILEIDKPIKNVGDLVKDQYGDIHIFTKNDGKEYGKTTTKLNIYITSDEEIKEGDWVIKISSLYKGGGSIQKYSFVDAQFEDITFKKIILTTDELYIHNDLIPKEYNPFPQYIQKIDDNFLEWFVKNPSCKEVEVEDVYKKFLNGDKRSVSNFRNKYKIIIPKEEPKQQTTLEEAMVDYSNDATQQLAFLNGAKWQQERSYSEEEVLAMLLDCRSENPIDVNKWFEQFKKK